MNPILISHNGIILVKLTFHNHPENLTIIWQPSFSKIIPHKFRNTLPYWINGVIKVFVDDFNDRIKGFLLLLDFFWRVFFWMVDFLRDQRIGELEDLVQDGCVFL